MPVAILAGVQRDPFSRGYIYDFLGHFPLRTTLEISAFEMGADGFKNRPFLFPKPPQPRLLRFLF